MATRMQQRRGTASQWTTANPVLAAGEIGFETDTNQFKIGDGVNLWGDLSYFKNLEDLGGSLDDYLLVTQVGSAGYAASLDVNGYIPVEQLGNVIGDAPQILNTLEELAGALQDVDGLVQVKIDTKAEAERLITDADIASAVEGEATARDNAITSALELQTTQIESSYNAAIDDAIASEVSARDIAIEQAITDESNARDLAIEQAITDEANARDLAIENATNVITAAYEEDATNKANLAESNANTTAQGYVSDHNVDTTNVHGIADTSELSTKSGIETLTNKTISTVDNNISVVAADIDDVTATAAELNILSGATLTTTELNYVDGVTSAIQTQLNDKAPKANPTFTGTLSAATVAISGNLTVGGTTTTTNTSSFTVNDPLVYFGEGNTGNIVDLGFVASYNDGAYHHAGLARDASDNKWKLFSSVEDEPTTTINFAQAEYDTLVVGGIEYSDGTQVKVGVPSLTSINQQAGAYTTVLTDRDKLVEVSSSTAVTITIPTNASVAYPVGTSIDILQTGTGQVTIAGAGGVTVNATPGLKLRTQWSSATLFKRATDTWVVFGDLSA